MTVSEALSRAAARAKNLCVVANVSFASQAVPLGDRFVRN